eukprot:UN25792
MEDLKKNPYPLGTRIDYTFIPPNFNGNPGECERKYVDFPIIDTSNTRILNQNGTSFDGDDSNFNCTEKYDIPKYPVFNML